MHILHVLLWKINKSGKSSPGGQVSLLLQNAAKEANAVVALTFWPTWNRQEGLFHNQMLAYT